MAVFIKNRRLWHIYSKIVELNCRRGPPTVGVIHRLFLLIFRLLESHVKRAEGVEDKSAEVTEIRNELLKAEEVTVEAAQIDIANVQEGLSPSRGQSIDLLLTPALFTIFM